MMVSAPVFSNPTSAELRPLMNYADWIELCETPPGYTVRLRRKLRSLRRHPLISILLPVYNPDLELLRAAIASVNAQIYPGWELCIADDASTDARVRTFLEEAAAAESRISVTYRTENGHIAAATNSALSLASGSWCGLLDQDDLLSSDALGLVACAIESDPFAALIYSDEDKIDIAGRRSAPFFKPDWNAELLLGQNYINHFGVYRADLLHELRGLREGFDGSQDYDLALRFSERLQPHQIKHIPRILYHWRAAPGSLAAAFDAKPAAKEGARRALRQHLERRGISAQVEASPENEERHRVIYDLPGRRPLVSVIIPMRDRISLLKRCLAGLRERTDYSPVEIVIVDNGSTEKPARDYLAHLQREEDVRVIRDEEAFNFSRLINRGAAVARGEVLVLLNNDTEADSEGWLTEMVSHVLQPSVGAVGARLWYQNRTLQHGGVILGLRGMAGHAFEGVARGAHGYFDRLLLAHDCSAVTAACMVVRKQVFDDFGGFDEEQFGVNFNDLDFCLRLQEGGLRVVWTPHADLLHHESASRGRERSVADETDFRREAANLRDRWGAQLLSDPFYNPNLSLAGSGYEIAFPPRADAFKLLQ